MKKQPKPAVTFTADEEAVLKNSKYRLESKNSEVQFIYQFLPLRLGVKQYGENFKKIKLRRFKFSEKTKDDLQKRWIELKKSS